MIHALKSMGKYAKDKSLESLLSQVVENPDSNGKYKTVLVILFKEEKEDIVFEDIRVEDFSQQKLEKYAYKKGSARGGDLTPTSRITDLEKTFQRIQMPLSKVCKKIKEESENQKIILNIHSLLSDKDVSKEIFEKLKKIEYSDSSILIIGFRNIDNEVKYVGDFEEFTESLMEDYEKKFYYRSSYTKADKKSIGKNNICYVCSQKAKKTYGYVGTFSFYTLDKTGFTSGGFNRGESWKNYPVCPKCAKLLDLGRKYLETNLSSRFCGINYFIMPKTVFDTVEDKVELFEILEELENHKKMSLEEKTRTALTDAQDCIFEAMTEFNNYANFNLMFYEEQNSAFRILLYVEDVLPSHIKKIFKAKEEIDEVPIFKSLKGTEGEFFDLTFRFNLISDFFYVNQRNKPNFTKQFLEITNSIFTGQKISYKLLIDRFTTHLQKKYINNESTSYDNLKALMILKFLKKLDLLTYTVREETNMKPVKGEFREQIENYLEEHGDILDCNVKRLVFLEGVFAQKLLNIQKKEKDGATPFRARLNGLKLNEKIVKRLYPEIKNKLEEYGKNYYKQLEVMISDYIMVSDFKNMSNNELSFYFVTGMNQSDKFQFKKD